MRRNALFVLGMHRSGTSALTGALARSGAHAGTKLMPATADNPEGYWEDVPLVGFNDALLKSLGTRWDSVAPMPEGWWKLTAAVAAREAATSLIAAEWGDARFAVVKDPRMCRLLRLWREAFQDAGFAVSCVLMTRRPMDVAASLARRDQFAPEKSLALWLSHLVEAERDSRGLPRAFVTYEALLADAAGTLERVRSDAAFPIKPTPAQQQAALALVRPDLNRQGSRSLDAPRAGMASSLDSTLNAHYAKLAALAPHVDPKDAIEALAREATGALAAALPPWLAHELAASQALARSLAADCDSARNSITKLEHEIATARKAHATRDEIETSLRTELKKSPASTDDIAALGRALRDEIAPLAAALAAAQEAARNATAAERAARDELLQAQRDLGDERATISALTAQIDHARVSANDCEQQIELARHHIDELAREIDAARRSHAARDDIEQSLTHERDELRTEVVALRADAAKVAPLASEVERLGRDLTAREQEVAKLAQQVRTAETALAASTAELERRAAIERRLDADRERLSVSEAEARDRVAALERELGTMTAEARALRGRLDVAASELERLSQRMIGRLARRLVRR
jgi:hypothetical protein